VIDRWVAFWDRREAPTSLALIRIAVGLVVLMDLLGAARAGAVPALFAPPPFGMGSGAVSAHLPVLASWLGASQRTALFLWWLAVVAAAMVLFGAAYRVGALALSFALAEVAAFQPDGDGIDRLLRIVVPILALSQAHARWSVDAWWRNRRGRPAPIEVPAWPRYLIVLQLVWLYFSAAHSRDDVSWWPQGGFSAIAKILADPHFARFAPGSLASVYPVTQLATAVTMLFELSAPLMALTLTTRFGRHSALYRWAQSLRLRWIWMATGASLHLGIGITMQIGIFPLGMLALYPAFLGPDDYARFS